MTIPARGQLADVSNPTVVGMGTAASCDFAHLEAAVTKGGVITFDCGSAPVTIMVTSTLNVPTKVNTVIDGGHLVTLDGGGSTQILSFNSPGWQTGTNSLTVQNITLTNAKETGTMAIPPAPQAACSQGYDDGQGGAIYMRDGALNVIDSTFTNNQAAQVGPDTGGGAIYVQGSKSGTVIVGSVFTGNSAANGGAVGGLFNELDVYNSTFMGNKATGHDANTNDMSMCSVMNNGQYEVGSGGNGGALYSDGNSVNVVLCGDDIEDNAAGMNADGGGLFFTSNNYKTAQGGTLTIADTTMTGNTGGHWTNVQTGSVKNVGTAVGTNNKSTTIANSMVQGVQ
jgi:predicted outer membrane repeat protein